MKGATLDPLDIAGLSEVAVILEVSKQRAYQLVELDGFPAHRHELASGRIWRRSEVEVWAEGRKAAAKVLAREEG